MVVVTRQPLVGISLAAITGIFFSPALSSWTWIIQGIGAIIIWRFFSGTIWILVATVCVFGCLHKLQTIESRAAWFARSLAATSSIWQGEGVITQVFLSARDVSPLVVQITKLRSMKNNYDYPLKTLIPWQGKPPEVGNTIEWVGLMHSLERSKIRHPFSLKRQAWLASLGIYFEFYKITVTKTWRNTAWHPTAWAIKARQRSEEGITRGIENKKKEAALIRALTLGAEKKTEKMLAEAFRRTGTYHIFSVSGLHIGMVAGIAWQVFKLCRIPQRIAIPLIIPLSFAYAAITGLRPPALRAACMGGLLLCGVFAKRRAFILNSLAAAALIILFWDTNQLFRPGFQLSFIVVAAIACLTASIYRFLHRLFMPDPFLPRRLWTPLQETYERLGSTISAVLAISLAAWLGSTPLLLWHFQSISFSALFINPFVVPLAFIILSLAILTLVCDLLISTWLATIFAHINLLPASLLLGIVEWGAKLTGGFFQWK